MVTRDTSEGGSSHNLLDPSVAERDIDDVERGEYDYVHGAPPCAPYSPAHDPMIYSVTRGCVAPPEWTAYARKHDSIASFMVRLIRASRRSGTPCSVENTPQLHVEGSASYWPKHSDRASFWDRADVDGALRECGFRRRTFASCAFGSPWRKLLTIAHSAPLEPPLSVLSLMGCPHGADGHKAVAYGLDDEGASLAAASAAYSPGLCRFLAGAADSTDARLLGSAGAALAIDVEAPTDEDPSLMRVEGGRVADGARLTPSLRRRVEERRRMPARFASPRNRRQEVVEKLRLEAMPRGLCLPPPRNKGRPRRKRRRLPRVEPPQGQPPHEARGDARVASTDRERWKPPGAPAGPIAVEDLHLPGVYETKVGRFKRRCARATAALAARAKGERVQAAYG